MNKSKKNYLELCQGKVDDFKASLPRVVDPAEISLKAKIPFKAITYREALLHRITELSDTSINLYKDKEKTISFMIIARSVHETFSLLYMLHKNMTEAIETKSVIKFDEYIMTNTFGYRMKGNDNLPQMPNILKAIDQVDKILDGAFRRTYESMSEFCHPNCAGVHSAYVKIDKENFLAYIGADKTQKSVDAYMGSLFATLEMFEHYYNQISKLMDEFIDICESEFR